MMNISEINETRKELQKVKDAIFMESMADFLNWDNYYYLRAKERRLEEKLKKLGG